MKDKNDKTVKVLIVDDSSVARLTLREILGEDPAFRVLADVPDGKEALRFLEDPGNEKPDVVTMDVMMPEMDGFETTRTIMETDPLPIVIITSSYKPDEVEKTFRAMEAGAVTILEKPGSITGEEFQRTAQTLRETVKLMAGVKVVRRWPSRRTAAAPKPPSIAAADIADIRAVVLGASTGGPKAILEILSMLPRKFPVPILIVQHISGEFIDGMVQWLGKSTGFPIHPAKNGQKVEPGFVYLAPDDFHMGITEVPAVSKGYFIQLSRSQPEEGLRPSVSYLFRSAARTYGKHAVGVLLTGMGRDGGEGLKAMKDAGAVTIAQDESTSIVYGMPAEAVKLGAARYVLPLNEIAGKIQQVLGLNPGISNEKE